MPVYDPEIRNWTNVTPITVPNDTVIAGKNFTQKDPWTEPFGSATGLVFQDCNLTNCVVPADAVIKHGDKVATYPTLADGKKHDVQRRWTIDVQSIEVEPGVFENWDVQQTRRVVGTPASWTDTEIIDETPLGPTGA